MFRIQKVRRFQKGFKSDHRMQVLFAHSKPGKARSTDDERLTEDLSRSTDVGVAVVQGLLEAHFPNVRASPGIQACADGSSPVATSVGWPLAV